MKIVTFNLRCDNEADGCNSFQNRKELVRKKLKQEMPDIICFQEVLPHMAQWLSENLPDYELIGCGREKDFSGEQVSIGLRKNKFSLISMETYWLSPTPFLPGSRYADQSEFPRICIELVLKMEEQVFRLINTHLDHRGKNARKLAVEQIVSKIEKEEFLPDIPVVLAGDFNGEPDSEERKLLKSETWDHLTKDMGYTFHGFTEAEIPQSIDGIYLCQKGKILFLPDKVEKWEDREGKIWLSDHYPVCVYLRMLHE